jgi:hypothetical protein
VEDHERRLGRRVLDQGGQLVQQVALDEVRRVGAGHVDGGAQPLAALLLLGPDHRLQPAHRVFVGHVDG